MSKLFFHAIQFFSDFSENGQDYVQSYRAINNNNLSETIEFWSGKPRFMKLRNILFNLSAFLKVHICTSTVNTTNTHMYNQELRYSGYCPNLSKIGLVNVFPYGIPICLVVKNGNLYCLPKSKSQ
jgi:hypothetical protein